MKLMTVKINNSIDHILNFEAAANQAAAEFVVETAGRIPLLAFYYDDDANANDGTPLYLYQTDKEALSLYKAGHDVTPVKDSQAEANYVGFTVDVNFTDEESKGKEEDSKPKEEIDCLEYDWDEELSDNFSTFFISLLNTDICYRVTVNVNITVNNKVLSRSFIVNVAPKSNIYDAVLDFGSEASQVFLYWRDRNKISRDLFKIYPGFKGLLGSSEDKDQNVLQFDNGDNCLYKSHFFIPKVIDTTLEYNPASSPRDIKLLKQYTLIDRLPEIRNEYVTLPNVKIATCGGVKEPEVFSTLGQPVRVKEFQKNYFYRASVNSFVYQILDYVANNTQDVRPCFVVLYALVPNIYNQSEVSEYIKYLRHDVNAIIEADETMKAVIKGVCISSVSESDASFLGFLSACSAESLSLSSGEYLIMDAGKGTLDFSVIDYDVLRSPCVKGVYRSGIVGAGNALTYAFLLNILSQIYSQTVKNQGERDKLISSFIKNKVHNADESELYKLMSMVEEFKKRFNDGILTQEWIGGKIQKDSEFELSGLINLLEQNLKNESTLSDYSIVEAMMDKIAADAVKKLSYRVENDIKKVIFTGRGFRLREFRTVMLNKLKELSGCDSLEEINISEDIVSMKHVCLIGLPYLNHGSYDGLMVGKPDILHQGEDILTKHEEKVNKIHKAEKKRTKSGRAKASFSSALRIIFRGDAKKKSGNDSITSVNNDYTNGVELTAKSHEDRVNISGNFYKVMSLQPGTFHVFFDGKDFWARQDEKLLSFGPAVDVETRMAYESMFPYAECDTAEIPIPRKQQVSADGAVCDTAETSKTVITVKPSDNASLGMTDDELAEKLKKNE